MLVRAIGDMWEDVAALGCFVLLGGCLIGLVIVLRGRRAALTMRFR